MYNQNGAQKTLLTVGSSSLYMKFMLVAFQIMTFNTMYLTLFLHLDYRQYTRSSLESRPLEVLKQRKLYT